MKIAVEKTEEYGQTCGCNEQTGFCIFFMCINLKGVIRNNSQGSVKQKLNVKSITEFLSQYFIFSII